MGDITLRVRAQTEQAQRAFEDLAKSSEETRVQMEKFAKRITGKELDNFTHRQKRLQVALTATKGETAALTQSVGQYEREIQRLIRGGLAPNSEQVKRLRNEQGQLQKRLDASRKAQERKTRALQTAKKAIKASAVAIAGVVTGVIALTKRNANLANNLANSARVVGLCIEAYQELDYVMRMSGIENGEYMLNRLNRSIIDVRNETGTLTKFLEENYSQLLDQLKNVNDNEEAFMLLMDAINRAPNEFKAAELAMAAFGRNGAQMVLTAQNGAEGINALREEARQLGLVSNENARAAMAFNDAMFRLRTSVQNMTQELTVKLLPALTNIIIRITEAVQRAGEFRARLQSLGSTLKSIYPVIATVAGTTATFVVTLKSTKYITTFIGKLKLLKSALNGVKVASLATTAAKKLAAYVKKGGIAGLVAYGAAAVAAGIALTALIRRFRESAEAASNVTTVFEEIEFPEFKHLAEDVADLNVELTKLAWGGAAAVVEAMEEVAEASKAAAVTMESYFKERLRTTEYAERHAADKQLGIIRDFLRDRMKYLTDDWYERYEFLREQSYLIKENELITADERYAIERELNRKFETLNQERVEAARQAAKNMMTAYSVFFGGFSQLLKAAGRDNVAFANAGRAVAIVQAGINTALAITKTMSQFGATPAGIAKAVGIGMKGAAQKARIASSMIPSAETGGRFIVPPSRGVDNSIMRVNPGETIDVTSRGMTGIGESFNFQLVVDGHVFAEVMNKRARAGELYTLQLATNYQGV